MELLIITGMSGAGKTQVIDVLEDNGYYCVDNVPPELIGNFAKLSHGSRRNLERIALVVDIRSHDMDDAPGGVQMILDELAQSGVGLKVLFLDCADETLVTRYKETRRRHPLLEGRPSGSIIEAILEERKILFEIRSRADFLIDTSTMSSAQLRARALDLFGGEKGAGMAVRCVSFGFKYGLPRDSDLVLDVRFLPNPFYDANLRPLCGMDKPIQDFLLGQEVVRNFRERLFEMLRFLVPLYIREGKSQLVISFGCTGGRHRSVAFAYWTSELLREYGENAECIHRDIDK